MPVTRTKASTPFRTSAPTQESPWITCSEAGRRLEKTPHHVRTLALTGRIKTKAIPGLPILYNASDVAALKDELSK
jgi:hypothetical protein